MLGTQRRWGESEVPPSAAEEVGMRRFGKTVKRWQDLGGSAKRPKNVSEADWGVLARSDRVDVFWSQFNPIDSKLKFEYPLSNPGLSIGPIVLGVHISN